MFLKYIVFISIYIVLSTPASCQIFDFFNRPPTIDEIDEPVVVLENSGNQSIILTGISYGGDRNFQLLTITAESSKPDLIPHPSINYEQGSIANLNFIPSQDQNGSTKISITLDDGQWYNNITEMSFKIVVTPVNGRPSFQLQPGPPAIKEGTGEIKIKKFAFNMDDGDPEEGQKLEFITAIKETTNNLTFKEEPSIDKKKGDLTYEVNPNGYGEATISVVLKDNGGTEDGGIDTSLESIFIIVVVGENDPPTLDPISNPEPISEDAVQQQIAVTGISAGDSENQPLTVRATSSNKDLISEITVNYTSPSADGSLSYKPNANKFGTSIITVIVDDGQSQNNTVARSFTVEVNPVADSPSITDAVITGGGQNNSGLVISRNPVDGEEVTHFKITNILNGTLYLNNGTTKLSNGRFITYAQGNSGLKFTPSSSQKDPGSFKIQAATGKGNQFLGGSKVLATITIENDAPTLNPISNPGPMPEDAARQQIALSGISAGDSENQPLTITATSSNKDLISEVSVNYMSSSKTGSISYQPNANKFGTSIITVIVDDGQSQNNTVARSFTVEVNPVADSPSITNAVITGGGQNTSGLVISRNPVDGEEVTHFKITNILNGTLYLNNGTTKLSNGRFITYAQGNSGLKFTPSSSQKDPGSFKIEAATGKGNQFLGGSKVLATITIENDAPTLNPISNPGPILEDAARQQIALSGISAGNTENQPLTITATSSNKDLISEVSVNYTSSSKTGSISYQPKANKFGTSIITVTVDDGQSQNNTVVRSCTVKVNPVADTPSITNAVIKGSGQTSSGLVMSRNPTDGEEVSHFKITNILNGTLYLNNGTTQLSNGSFITYAQGKSGLKFTHSYGHKDPGSFNIQAATGKGNQFLGGAKVGAEITIDNDPPEITSIPVKLAEETSYYSYKILVSDADLNDQLKYTFIIPVKIRPWLKSLENDDNSAVLFGTPPSGSQGIYDIYVKVKDLFGQYDEQRFKLEVKKLNNKPELTPIVENIDEDEPLDFSLSLFQGHYKDLDGDELMEIKIVNTPQKGHLFLTGKELTVNDVVASKELSKFKYVPDRDYHGSDVFGWTASDGKDYSPVPEQVSIFIAPVNDAPNLNAISNPGPLKEDAAKQQIALSGISAGNTENQPLTITATSSNKDLISEVSVNYTSSSKTGSISYQPKANKFGTSIITVTVDDGQSQNNTVVRSCTVKVNPVADTPSITNAVIKGSGQTSSGLVMSRNPTDGEEVSHFKITNILNGTLYLNNGTTQLSNGSFITYAQGKSGLKFTHSYGHKDPGSFNIQAATGKGNQFLGGAKVGAEITIDNDPPEITSIPVKLAEETSYYSYKILVSETDPNDQLKYTFIIPERIRPWLKSLENDDNSVLLFGTPPSGSQGIYDIYVKVEDLFGQYDEQSFQLEVNIQNNKPELTPIAENIDEDEPLDFSLSLFQGHYKDLDGDELKAIKVINTPQKGRLLLGGRELTVNDVVESKELSKFKYVPDKDYHGLDVFDWSASDGKGYSLVPQRVSIFIASVNDAPEIINMENTPIIFEFGDDGKNLTYSSIVFDADGDKIEKMIIRIAENYVQGEDSIYYEQIDGITYQWEDELGELTARGIEKSIVYENLIRSLKYINVNRLSPSKKYRLFEFVLYDADTFSLPFARFINFENTYEELVIPTGFTPNDDGVNDSWEIRNLSRYKDIKVSILSRSGKIIYESENHREWDGTYNGNLVPAGPYYYLINIDRYKKVYRGTVYVLR